ncbi:MULTISPECIES: AMP-binding protein [unclassified Anaerobiospirillum]|uniref:AMP-binding protein n=1 Tax=unclassified Anaerobiospirillum TaxID=2647410 RepID=UPI001FF1A05D|nr:MULTISPECIES: AMP-binding protein [unclassified Anaerobiospirillum]MCK0534741.1 AMP-binding protein [Anaerobiospirillum sp. NML120511]MCK0540005.1 AMP-binding protein [Anaerobiospirillum sp. NML02-A-032]
MVYQWGGGKRDCALIVKGSRYSYTELRQAVFTFASFVKHLNAGRIALYTRGTFETYQSLLGSLLSGITAAPLNPRFPALKNAFIIEHSACTHVFIDSEYAGDVVKTVLDYLSAEQISRLTFIASESAVIAVNEALDQQLQLLASAGESVNEGESAKAGEAADAAATADMAGTSGKVELFRARLVTLPDFKAVAADDVDFKVPEVDADNIMHILYTSGTTGEPKGVMVTQGNYAVYLTRILKMYQFGSDDVFSHFAEITFDISLQDVLCSIISGATLVCPSDRDRAAPHKYLLDNAITVLHASPSMISYMHRIRVVDRIKLPSLRMCILIGEALWFHQLRQLHKMAPSARLINTYGPTEATVAVSGYEVLPADLEDDSLEYTIVPLGRAFTGVELLAVDEHLAPVAAGAAGELLIGGDQVTAGYWHNEAKNSNAFIERNGSRWYRTGDIVRASTGTAVSDCLHGSAGEGFTCWHYIGRNDDMVKVGSYRISLYEVDEKLAMLTEHAVVTVSCNETYDGLDVTVMAALIEGGSDKDMESIKDRMAQVLPDYMRPKFMLCVPEFPLNTNGKVDRRALKDMLISVAPEKFGITLRP